MPTPVATAKQCLNSEASHALEEAVKVARRRGHAQTTSLHLVSAFMSLSPSQLREACVRALNTSFNPRLQLKALDFCLNVSLERLPASQPRVDEPPVANSLMAAIKRSQANQRRQPESMIAIRTQNQLLGQCQDQLGTPTSGVKVELQHLMVAILDDPTVSRVFNEAGFTSFDIKLAILRPFQSFFRYPQRGRGHQGLFLCNLDGNSDPGRRPFRFPFSGYCGNWDGQENYRRIGEVLMRRKGRNPLLVGVCANDALIGFTEVLERRMDMLPMELGGIKVVSIEKDVLKFVNEQWSDEGMSLRFKEVGMMVQNCLGPGLMLSFGNLRHFLGGENGFGMDVLNSIVKKLTKLLEIHGGRVWLIGFAANDQTYVEFLSRYPSIDKDWDLHLLPITSVKPMMGGESCFKSSLMGSFVPFGGFFTSPDLKSPFSSSYHVTCRSQSSQNLEQERSVFPLRGSMASVADKHSTVLSPWLQMGEPVANSAYNELKAKGGKMLLDDTLESLQMKWSNRCQHFQHTQSSPEPEDSQECSQLPTGMGSNHIHGKVKKVHNEKHLTSHQSNSVLLASSRNDNFVAKISGSSSATDHSPRDGSWLCISGSDDSQTSPSGVSVVTELGLELFPGPCKQQRKESAAVNENHAAKCSTDPCFHLSAKPKSNNFKTLFEALFRRVGRQYEAVRKISHVIADSCVINGRLQSSGLRGDIWLNCIGSDVFGKKKIALALANMLYGSENNFVHVDFDSTHDLLLQKKVFGHQILDGSDVKFRGKTVVDHIAEELRKIPFGIVFLENVHSADPVAQCSLSQAMKTGRFSDSHGREVPINNRIFVLTSEDNSTPSQEKQSNLLEERISSTKALPIQITVRTRENTYNQIFVNKRKLGGKAETKLQSVSVDTVKRPHRGLGMSLDLNLPAEVNDDDGRYNKWLGEFSSEVEKTSVKVVFDPFNYDALSTKVLKWVHQSFRKAVGFECSLEIDPKVMDQILAAACSSEADDEVKDWIDQVLGNGFAEAQKRFQLTANSVVTVGSFAPLYMEEQGSEACLLPPKIVLP